MDDKAPYKLPKEWVERIFMRLQSIYGEAWISQYEKSPEEKNIFMTAWSSGLSGLTAAEIRHAISICQSSDKTFLPNVIDFYRYAKSLPGYSPKVISIHSRKADPEIAKAFLDEIKHKLSGKMKIS